MVDAVRTGRTTLAGRGYLPSDLSILQMMSVSSGYLCVLVFSLYINSDSVAALYGSPELLWAICPILLFWLSRLMLVAHRGEMHDDPIVYTAKDGVSLLVALLVLIVMATGAFWL